MASLTASRTVSGWLKMVVPEIDVNGVLRSGLLAPQLARGEAYGIDMLRVLAEEVGVGVGKDEHPMIALNCAEPSASVARQSRVAGRVDVARANALADAELRRDRRIALGRHTIFDQCLHLVDGQRGSRLLRTASRLATIDLSSPHEARRDVQLSH